MGKKGGKSSAGKKVGRRASAIAQRGVASLAKRFGASQGLQDILGNAGAYFGHDIGEWAHKQFKHYAGFKRGGMLRSGRPYKRLTHGMR